ncbi:unnamed protein product [Parnassius apollo]|uniref:(apollo) hypothetical protein n=1 Tax=Parnassius apollo TaxID=110799 RepID=A0A8S3WPC0_PARAO|nr:unnamed protein product [Parnassius apollo]
MEEFIDKCLKEQDEDQENINPWPNTPLGLGEITFFDDKSSELKKDDWVVVQFTTRKKNVKHFVATILSYENHMPVIKFVRKVKETRSDTIISFTYPVVKDISVLKHT